MLFLRSPSIFGKAVWRRSFGYVYPGAHQCLKDLDQLEAKYEELTQALASPDITNDSARYQKTAKAHSEISETVEKYREYKDLSGALPKAVL